MNVKSYTIPKEIWIFLLGFFPEEITYLNFAGLNELHLFSTDKYFCLLKNRKAARSAKLLETVT